MSFLPRAAAMWRHESPSLFFLLLFYYYIIIVIVYYYFRKQKESRKEKVEVVELPPRLYIIKVKYKNVWGKASTSYIYIYITLQYKYIYAPLK